jgi:hypothetical protein
MHIHTPREHTHTLSSHVHTPHTHHTHTHAHTHTLDIQTIHSLVYEHYIVHYTTAASKACQQEVNYVNYPFFWNTAAAKSFQVGIRF